MSERSIGVIVDWLPCCSGPITEGGSRLHYEGCAGEAMSEHLCCLGCGAPVTQYDETEHRPDCPGVPLPESPSAAAIEAALEAFPIRVFGLQEWPAPGLVRPEIERVLRAAYAAERKAAGDNPRASHGELGSTGVTPG